MNDSQHKILICVDDEPSILQMLSFQLNNKLDAEKYVIECFTNPTDVLAELPQIVLEGQEITLIVDFQMPKMNGAELVKQIKATFPACRCIMLSGQSNEVVVNQLLNDRILDNYISKPWKEEVLMNIIES